MNGTSLLLKLITILLFSSALFGQERRPHFSESYNDKYYNYGVPLNPIQTPRKLIPGFKKNHYHRFGFAPYYGGRNFWLTYHYEIVF